MTVDQEGQTDTAVTGPAITVATVVFGHRKTVVYWHPTGDGGIGEPILKADYRGVFVRTGHVNPFLDDVEPTGAIVEVPQGWIDQAESVAAVLAGDRHADLTHMATHHADHL